MVIKTKLFTRLIKAENRAVAIATHQYGAFLDMPVVLAWVYTRNEIAGMTQLRRKRGDGLTDAQHTAAQVTLPLGG